MLMKNKNKNLLMGRAGSFHLPVYVLHLHVSYMFGSRFHLNIQLSYFLPLLVTSGVTGMQKSSARGDGVMV